MTKLSAGRLVGRYQVDSYINEGGMQEVYRATDTILGRTVALKTPKNDDGERRFDRSARASARVNQANVARTLDYFESSGRQLLVEEHVEGLDLGALLKRIPQLDPYAAAQILHALARGIASVHAEGVVHRDLKPSNIMISGGVRLAGIKLTDFGVARMAQVEIDSEIAGGLNSLTGSKTLIGHLPYLAPEILRRRSTVSSAADIWAVGALGFHFLAGRPPFGVELAEAVTQILTAPIPPLPPEVVNSAQFRGLAMEIYGIVAACLHRDENARPSARQLVESCERLCYPVLLREVARVVGYPGGTFGFADSATGQIFFHKESVFGALPRVGEKVWFLRHKGTPHDRAHPVVAMTEPS